ncbi:decarboxylating NADP(+)-dependent phosphogluconate dehydrogenase [Sulfurimonas sp. HSL-1716]|uniref:decarboxylating NADP(+)-dependent phosphogluconate dehydrogenase n=1 Tax=Hydrocurvibacter sulfurireducens TaxID=3131937 RepID=UPI0031F88AC5
MKYDIGVYGLGVMGQNIALNFANHGFNVAVFNRYDVNEEKAVQKFMDKKCRNKTVTRFLNINDFVSSLKNPKKILMMITAGNAVDKVIEETIQYLAKNDILIDGGNSHYEDTKRRLDFLASKQIRYLGCGISGGSEGALKGPSIMVGGDVSAWNDTKEILQAIAAKDRNNEYCCRWIGSEGSGHFVKMVHNGIEYSLMQIIAESYDMQKRMLNMQPDEIKKVYDDWNEAEGRSYLMKITAQIVTMTDKNGNYILDEILDSSSHKGTGKDTSIAALNLGVPAPPLTASVNERYISSLSDLRFCYSSKSVSEKELYAQIQTHLLRLKDAQYLAQIISYVNGLMIISEASDKFNWNINIQEVAKVWLNGCIIESEILYKLVDIIEKQNTNNKNLLLSRQIIDCVNLKVENLRETVLTAITHRIPIPVMSSVLSFLDSISSEVLPANLIQAQRDYFGQHGYQKKGMSDTMTFHLRNDNENI